MREKRVRPATDKKILVSWNSLAIEGMINAYKASGNRDYYESAKKSFTFIKNNMYKKNKLYACYHDREYFSAYLDD